MDGRVELHLRGEGAAPGQLRGHELAEILTSLEDAIAAYVVAKEPDLSKDAIRVGLYTIEAGSLVMVYDLNLQEYTVPAFRAVADAVIRNAFQELPRQVLAPLRTLVRFVQQREYEAELRIAEDGETRAVLNAETVIPPVPVLKGETVIYGEVLRTGGAEPKIMMRTVQGKTIYCDATRKLAQDAGNHLYQTVALRGQATWNGETLEIEEFRVETLLEYAPVSASQAFAELAALVDDSFYDLASPTHFLKELRA